MSVIRKILCGKAQADCGANGTPFYGSFASAPFSYGLNAFLRLAGVLSALAVILVLLAGPATAKSGFQPPVESVSQIVVDDDGLPLNFPSAVFFDPYMEETYVVNGGSGRVVVYGPDFFPRVSIGKGRGIIAPTGGAVMANGEVYICQVKNFKNPSPRITVLNGAFFIDREILLDEIPEADRFIPRTLAVSSEGLIYLAGDNNVGVLVLDEEGSFLRKIQPVDQVYARTLARKAGEIESEEPLQEEKQGEEQPPEEDPWADIPEEFRPRKEDTATSGSGKVEGPARIRFVHIDSSGKLYLVSSETDKIYVYDQDESFLFSFGDKGGSPGQLSLPTALTIDEKNRVIYVVDYMRHTILAYSDGGEFLFEINGRGFTPGWFNYPNGITINSQGELVVADLLNRRVQVLDVAYEEVAYMFRDQEEEDSVLEYEIREPEGDSESDPEPANGEGIIPAEDAKKPDNTFEVTIQPSAPDEDQETADEESRDNDDLSDRPDVER